MDPISQNFLLKKYIVFGLIRKSATEIKKYFTFIKK